MEARPWISEWIRPNDVSHKESKVEKVTTKIKLWSLLGDGWSRQRHHWYVSVSMTIVEIDRRTSG